MSKPPEEHYIVNEKYRCRIVKYTDHHTVLFGGSKRCMYVTIHLDDKIAHIDGAGWHAYCDINGKLAKGRGTIDMIRSCIFFIFKRYKIIERITLVDTSFIKCNDDIEVSLAAHYIVKHGKTWYEKHFDARLEEDTDRRKWDALVPKLIDTHKPSFVDFYNKYIATAYLVPKHKDHLKKILAPIYDSTPTIGEFLKGVDAEYDCIVFQEWLQNFFKLTLGINLKQAYWSIDRKTNKALIIKKSKERFEWSQFGGVPSHILLRHGV